MNSASSGFQYDAAGDVTNDGANQYLYDAEGRMCTVETLPILPGGAAYYGYIYDAEGRRVAKGSISAFSCDLSSNGFTLTESYVLAQGGEQLTMQDQNENWERTNVYGSYLSLNSIYLRLFLQQIAVLAQVLGASRSLNAYRSLPAEGSEYSEPQDEILGRFQHYSDNANPLPLFGPMYAVHDCSLIFILDELHSARKMDSDNS